VRHAVTCADVWSPLNPLYPCINLNLVIKMALFRSQLWDGRKHFLDRMSVRDLIQAYFAHPAIKVYLIMSMVSIGIAIVLWPGAWLAVLSAAFTMSIYGLVWYLLHRFVLHGSYLFRSAVTAPVWKRIHFDHHSDPNDLGVLFGALPTTLPTIAIATIPVGYFIAGYGGASTAFAVGLLMTCGYEFCHCIQHLTFNPKWVWLKKIKRLHMAHHFHSEKGNFGITNFFWDRLFTSYYDRVSKVPASSTVRNLGYTPSEYDRYPWVASLSGLEKADSKTRED
jgi:sterol desaturase/sphingolipid hydroxylase (fatty acid hydroxylase superfamily)